MYWDSQQGCLSVAQDYMILPFGSVFALIISSPSLKFLFIVHKFFSASLSCLYWSTLSSGMSWFDLSLWWHVTFSYCMCLTRCSAVLAANITNCEWVLLVGQFAGKGSWEIWFQSMCSLSCLGFIIVKFFIIERCNSIVGCVHTGRLLPKLSTVATLGWALMAIAADEVNELTAGSQVFQNNNHSCDCLSFLLCSCLLSSSQCPTVWNGSCCLFISPGPSPAIRLAPCAPSATPSHNATTDFSPLCCWAWPALLLGLREQTQKSRFSLIWCLALSSCASSVGDVNTAPLAASTASSTDISSCAKHVSVTAKFSMPVTDTTSPDTAQQREWEIVAKNTLLCWMRDW